jgi:hypothetical protein
MPLMTPKHPRWDEFCERLEGPEGCHFRPRLDQPGSTWTCAGGRDKTFAIQILTAMGFSSEDIAWSLQFFEVHGGFCDCEILFNVAAPAAEEG